MDDLNIIDQFTQTFVAYIESGFGLLSPDIAFLTTILIGIDITLAGLFWALSDDKSVVPALIKKILYIGAFAFIINNFSFLSTVIFESFAGLGLNATGTSLTIDNLMRPGFIAASGYGAAQPILVQIGDLVGPVAFFENFVTILVLVFAWLVVILAFFILAIQLFMTILEFKLTTLAGFVLIPFALWNKTSFLAEKVLGNIMASGIKLMVLAVIVGIGATIFGSFATTYSGQIITLEQALSTVLAALALFVLGIFGPGIAAGLITGAPQLGAGAIAGSALGLGLGAVAATKMMASTGSAAVQAGTALANAGGQGASGGMASSVGEAGQASGLKSPSTSYQNQSSSSNPSSPSNKSSAPKGSSGSPTGSSPTGSSQTGSSIPQEGSNNENSSNEIPPWAAKLKRAQHVREGATLAAHTLRDGDNSGSGESPQLKDNDQ